MQSKKGESLPEKIISTINLINENDDASLRTELSAFLNELINKDFNALIQLLYRIDVNEKKLKNLLKQHKDTDASSIIADLIIERQLQKIALKKQFSNKDKKSSEEEW